MTMFRLPVWMRWQGADLPLCGTEVPEPMVI